jgi:hypothetical protein
MEELTMHPKSLLNSEIHQYCKMIPTGIVVMDTRSTQVILGPPDIECLNLILRLMFMENQKDSHKSGTLMLQAIPINNPCSTIFALMSKVVIKI